MFDIERVSSLSEKRDYYEVLGIRRDADASAIKKAYRKLAKKYHPDSNEGNKEAAEHFKEVTEAYEILSNPEKKKLYDQFGHAAFDGTGAAGEQGFNGSYGFNGFGGFGSAGQEGFRGFNSAGKGGSYSFHGFSGGPRGGGFHSYHFDGGGDDGAFEDIFGDLFGHGGFGQKAGGSYGSSYGSRSRKGSDVNAEISISFDDAAFGCDKFITLTGADGTSQKLKVHIPAGIDDGQNIRLKGKGNPGLGGAEAGDLFLKVQVGTRPGFERRGMDVYSSLQIPFTTAVLGGEAIVPTLYGNVVCKIREGTACGSKIRLGGKGIVSMKNPQVKGDQYVTIQIEVPKNLTVEAKRKLREFDSVLGGASRSRNSADAA